MLYRIRQNNHYGFIDETGVVVVPPVYDLVGDIRFDACIVVKGDKFGLISQKGEEIISPAYASLGVVGKNRICLKDRGQFALAAFDGQLLTQFAYDGIFNFSEGLAATYIGLYFGYLDENGKERIPLQFDFAEAFNNGYAMVKQDGKVGLINKWGVFEKEHKYDFYDEYENCYVVNIGGVVSDDQASGGKFGILSKNNIELVTPGFDFIGPFQHGEAVVMKNNLYGSINEKGEIVIPVNSPLPVRTVREKIQKIIKDHKIGLATADGKQIIPPVYDDLIYYPDSLLCWVKKNGLYGILDLENNFIVEPSFELRVIYPIRKEEVHIELPFGKHGLLSIPSGNWILPPEYDFIGVFKGSLVELKKEGKMGYANREGKIVWME